MIISILFFLWCSDVGMVAKNNSSVGVPVNSLGVKNETAGVGAPNSSLFTEDYCMNEVNEMIITPHELTSGHIANAHDEKVHINWKMTVKPPYLAMCLKKVILWYGGNPNDTYPDRGSWKHTKREPFAAKDNSVFKITRAKICVSKNKIFIEYFSFRTHYHPTAVSLDKKKVKLSSCPTPSKRQEPMSDSTIWALVFGALLFFIVCLLCLLRQRKEEPGSSFEEDSDTGEEFGD